MAEAENAAKQVRSITEANIHDLRGRVDPSPLETQRRLERGRSDVVVKTDSNRRAFNVHAVLHQLL